MGYLISVFTTIVVLAILLTRIKHINIMKRGLELNKNIFMSYIDIFKEHRLFKSSIYLILIIFAGIFTFIFIDRSIYNNFRIYHLNNVIFRVIASLLACVIVYYSIGYVLFIFSRINKFIRKTEDREFKIDLILSYFIISTYLAIMLIFPVQFEKIGIVALISVIISYLLNLRLLFRLMRNPVNVKSKKETELSFNRVITASLLILVMIILNLYLAVCILYGMNHGAYNHVDGYFSLFYYTIISFSSLGYGDIVPLTIDARILGIIIAITSVMCLTIFLGSILSYRDKLK